MHKEKFGRQVGFVPYDGSTGPPVGSVSVTVVILTQNEEVNISRALRSAGWAAQILVVDSGSTDSTVELAERYGATVVRHGWEGFASQREYALRHPAVRHSWIYLVDADEWVSAALAAEIAEVLTGPVHDAYRQRKRVIFLGGWIRHCGWYWASWHTLLLRRDRATVSTRSLRRRRRRGGSPASSCAPCSSRRPRTWVRRCARWTRPPP